MTERILRIVSPIGLLVIWEVTGRLGWLDTRFFPTPSAIVGSFVQFIASGEIVTNTAITLQRILVGGVAGGVPGILVGLLAGINRVARAAIEPIMSVLYPIPKIAIIPLLLLIFGFGEQEKYAVVAIGVFFIMAINTIAGVRQIDRTLLDVGRSFRVRRSSFYLRILLPGAMPNIFAGIKLSIGIAIVLAVAAEFTAAKSGLGFQIWNSWQTLQVERMYVGLVMISLLGYVLTLAAEGLERLVIPWQAS
ncbi:MAG: ABC transporter permease [Candidatus Eremiobacteraeota bacterium]|nr:ABC transporter permease [Candidatus Eremiobacteraeota bacterium]MBV8355861.1 ABC transporter permease [Candidatus Eremiobacteraeota bacterium]